MTVYTGPRQNFEAWFRTGAGDAADGWIENSDDVYIMYFVEHEECGPCIMASLKEDGWWNDVYLAFDGNGFVKAGRAM